MEELSRKSFDPNQNEFWQGYHFDYDAWGNTEEIKVWKPTSGTAATPTGDTASLATYQYNVNGTLARMNYPSGQYVTYEYDLLDRLVKEVYYNSNDTIQVEYQYIYSSDGQLAKQQAIRNGSVVESYRFEYDSLGRLIRSREGGDNNSVQRTEHLYDGANRLTGFSLNYAYDALKRSSGVTIKKANGSELFTRSYSYWDYAGDNTRTTSRLKTYENTDANGNLMTGYRYTYDVNGNITKIEEAYTANAYRDLAVYAYDDLNQLDSETRYSYTDASATPATTTVVDYSIDTAGNLRSVSGGAHSISYTYSDSSWADLLTGITVDGTSRTISYSSAGNPDNWYNGTDYTNLVWEQGRRLSSVTKHMTDGTRTYDYAYDMSGVRSSKTIEIVVDGVLRHRRYDYVTQNGKVVRETAYYTDGAGEFMHCMDFFYDEKGNPFAMRKYSDETLSNFNNYYYVLNAQGDVVKLIAPSGSVYAEYTYDAWGNILDSSGSLRNTNPLRYRGYYYDKETGFYYLQSRYYDPIVKRFLNADTYSSTGTGFLGYNMFAYCENNPVNNQDPTGEILITTLILIGAITVGVGTAVYTGVKAREAGCGWAETIVHSVMNGLMAYSAVYTFGTTAYGCYQDWCYLNGRTPVVEIGSNNIATAATTGTPYEIGRAGENLAGIDQNAKTPIEINGRTRIPDALTENSLIEVKNVKYISNTLQVRHFSDYANATGRSLELYVRPTTRIAKTVIQAGWNIHTLW